MWDIKAILKELEKQGLTTDDCDYYLGYGVSLDKKELELLNSRRGSIQNGFELSLPLEEVAQMLNFYTPRGYDYARDHMKLNLPHPRLIRKTFVNTGGKPGYLQEMLDAVKLKAQKAGTPPNCALTMVMMMLNWDEKGDFGCEVDFGGPEQCDSESKEVLIFMVTFLEEAINVPIGYFMVASMDEHQMVNMTIGSLELLHEAGVNIVALSAELQLTVFRALKLMGCSFKMANFKTSFDHPITKEPVAVFLDPCKSIEYIRLALQANSPIKLVTANRPPINWSHVEKLIKLLEKKNEPVLHDALNKAHINIRGKQKGNSACWIMSSKLAEAATVISQECQVPDFEQMRPTVEFIELFNKVYETLSSRALAKPTDQKDNHKAPITTENCRKILAFFKTVETYMKGLKGKKGNLLVHSDHPGEGMGFIGLLACMHSAAFLNDKLVQTNKLKVLALHKFSLEHLELMMNNIRSQYGVKYYNEPKSRHVKEFFQKLIQRIANKDAERKFKQLKKESMLKNYSAVETINVTACRAAIFDCDHLVDPIITKDHDESFQLVYSAPQEVRDYTNPIHTYVAGFVANFLFTLITCEVCNNALLTSKDPKGKRATVTFRDDFGPVLPSKDVIKVCEKTEWFIQHGIKVSHTLELKARNLYKPTIVNKTLESLVSTGIFDSIASHQFDQGPTENHVVQLIKAVAEVYVDVRFRHLPVVKGMANFVPDRYKHKPSYFNSNPRRLRLTASQFRELFSISVFNSLNKLMK